MSFYFSECPLCGSELELDEESTVRAYMKDDFSVGSDFILVGEKPPTTPDYLVISCVNPKCNYLDNRSIKSLLEDLRDGWSRMAWLVKQQEAANVFDIQAELVEKFKKLPPERLAKLERMEDNAYMRSILKQVRNEKP